jgi:hypothetical protein
MGVQADKITLIPGSGVDTDRYQPAPEPDGPITFGFAGRLLTAPNRSRFNGVRRARDQQLVVPALLTQQAMCCDQGRMPLL